MCCFEFRLWLLDLIVVILLGELRGVEFKNVLDLVVLVTRN